MDRELGVVACRTQLAGGELATDDERRSVVPPSDVPRDLLTFPPRDLPESQGIVTTPCSGRPGPS